MLDFKKNWPLLILIVVVLAFFTISSMTSRKRKKLEREKRQKDVKDIIKQFMRQQLGLQHKRIEFEQVVARTSQEYRYRDVFDVIVRLYDARSNELFATKAFEIEGFTKLVAKKDYQTIWKVNGELDLDVTLKKIALQKTKRKLKNQDPEAKKMLVAEKKALKAAKEKTRKLAKIAKKNAKIGNKPKTPVAEKFTGFSSK